MNRWMKKKGCGGVKQFISSKKSVFRLSSVLLCICAVLFAMPVQSASAAVFIEQVDINAPKIKAYVQGDVNVKTTFKGLLNGLDKGGNSASVDLVQEGATRLAAENDTETRYIFLLDNSGSVSEEHFQAVKQNLVAFRKKISKREKDRMDIYTVGVDSPSKGKVTVLENAGRSEGEQSDIKKIQAIKRDGKKTVLYRSINEITGKSMPSGTRTVLILLTDGEDDSTGSKNDPKTTFSNVKNAAIPVYGIILAYGLSGDGNQSKITMTKRILNTMGENDRMVRGSDISARNKASAVDQAFQTLQNRIWEKTFIVNLLSNSNRTLSNAALILIKTNGKSEESKKSSIGHFSHVSDNEPPELSDITVQSAGKIGFTIRDTNGLNKDDILNQANYKIFRADDGKMAEEAWGIKKVEIPSAGDGTTEINVEITTEEGMYDGNYIIKISGLRDASEEANAIEETEKSFTVKAGLTEKTEVQEEKKEEKNLLQKYPWIPVLVLLFIFGIIIIIILLKKKNDKVIRMETNPDDLNMADSRLITLTVTDGKGLTKELQWDVEGSFFVGRSDICEVFFDDDKLSKQHFVIEVTKMGCYVEDLNSTNGTFINGVRLSGRRMLSEGDRIGAGREEFCVQSFQKSFDSIESTASKV